MRKLTLALAAASLLFTLVPTHSGCGVEARATTALFSVNRREAAARESKFAHIYP